MKNIKLKIIGVLVGIILLSGVTFAFNTISSGYRTSSSYRTIPMGGSYSKRVRHTGSNSYFVPTRTLSEWLNFINHKPSDVSITSVVRITNDWHCRSAGRDGVIRGRVDPWQHPRHWGRYRYCGGGYTRTYHRRNGPHPHRRYDNNRWVGYAN